MHHRFFGKIMLKENIQRQNGKGNTCAILFSKKEAAHTVELVYWIVDIWALQIISPLMGIVSVTAAIGILQDLLVPTSAQR